MQRIIVSTAFLALLSHVTAGDAGSWAAPADEVISFVDGDWEDKCEGEIFPIKWSKGNGKHVTVTVKDEHGWEEEICSEGAAPGDTEWEVEVPKCDVEYSIWLEQEECEALESPKFYVNCAAEEEQGGWGGKPSVVVVYDDAECTCQKTKTTAAPTHTSSVWWDEDLKCSVTASPVAPAKPTGNGWDKPVAPAEASASGNGWGKPVAPAEASASGNGWGKPVAPETTAPPAPPASSGGWGAPVASASGSPSVGSWPGQPSSPVAAYKGAATKVGASAFAMVAVFGAALLL